MMQMREAVADYVGGGAGSVGCVIAAQLSEDPSVSVALLESGKADRLGETRIPAGLMRTLGNARFDVFQDRGGSLAPRPD